MFFKRTDEKKKRLIKIVIITSIEITKVEIVRPVRNIHRFLEIPSFRTPLSLGGEELKMIESK